MNRSGLGVCTRGAGLALLGRDSRMEDGREFDSGEAPPSTLAPSTPALTTGRTIPAAGSGEEFRVDSRARLDGDWERKRVCAISPTSRHPTITSNQFTDASSLFTESECLPTIGHLTTLKKTEGVLAPVPPQVFPATVLLLDAGHIGRSEERRQDVFVERLIRTRATRSPDGNDYSQVTTVA